MINMHKLFKATLTYASCAFIGLGIMGANNFANAEPKPPKPIQNLVDEGAQIRYLGNEHGLDAWLTIKNGQEQYFYVLPDKSAFLMGVLFDKKGKIVTVEQVRSLMGDGDELLDELTTSPSELAAKNIKTSSLQTPAERLFSDIEDSNWVPLGQAGAPILYSFIDPQCPHCHAFINDVRSNYIDAGKLQVRLIPVGFREETMAQAAYLLATPNPQERWFKYMDGDETALPIKEEMNQQGIQRNMLLMQSWKFDATPMIVYRGKDGEVKIVRGRPKDIPRLISDLGSRS